MSDQVALRSNDSGFVLRVRSIQGVPRFGRYEVTLEHTASAQSLTAGFEDLHDLVEFIGYPKRSQVEDRTAALQSELEATRADLSLWTNHAQALDVEWNRLKSHLRTLLTSLDGAWWLKAAHAYHELAASVDLEREP